MPGTANVRAARLFGRCAWIWATSSGVSTHSVPRVVLLREMPSYEKKKNRLSRLIGPPMLAAVWLSRWLTRCGVSPCGPPHCCSELRPGVLRLNTALPWNRLVPFCDTTWIWAPVLRPNSAE